MARLVLKFEGRTIHEYGLGLMVTIGRTPDNILAIDNPAVSSHHACVFRDGDDYAVEDLQSTNGTFVNDKRVSRHTLRNGDVIIIGKHTLEFDEPGTAMAVDVADSDEPTLAALGDTVFLDTQQHRALLARLPRVPASAPGGDNSHHGENAAPSPTAVPRATLRVVGGRSERPEYSLDANTTLIGKSAAALVRLHGWFKPGVAVAIARTSHGYLATPISGKALVNGSRLTERRELSHGDILRVSGLTLEFSCDGPHAPTIGRLIGI